ncbi:MAG TPA: SelT/SelW/SelH family protein [Solimonas sp.]|nr:SelT/SelW/SelH family protein [Solimonas sp.]
MNRVEIEFCMQCRWLLRAGWVAQELLTTFPDELQEVSLKPGKGGIFQVRVNGVLVADRARDGGFMDLPLLKQAIRDRVAPERDLGHSERKPAS